MPAKTQIPLLQGVKQICDAWGLSEQQFYQFLKLRMPARQINGRWYAHMDNLAAYFRALTGPQKGKPQRPIVVDDDNAAGPDFDRVGAK